MIFAHSKAQWTYQNTSSWIPDQDYGQPYVRIAVTTKGLQTVSSTFLSAKGLPIITDANKNKLHLYHRGKEVDIISVNPGSVGYDIVFYGEPNDGALDSLLFRPITARTNIYHSLYTNQGSYMLTLRESDPDKPFAESYTETGDVTTPEPYHLQTDVKAYTGHFSQSVALSSPSFLESYYLDGKGWTDTMRVAGQTSEQKGIFRMNFKNRVYVPSLLPKLDLMVYGRSGTSHSVNVSVGKDYNSLRLGTNLAGFSDFTTKKGSFQIVFPEQNSGSADINTDGSGVIQLRSTFPANSNDSYSMTYYRLTYPQSFDMTGLNTAYFNLLPASGGLSRVEVPNSPGQERVFDLTDKDKPKEIKFTSGGLLNLTIRRSAGQSMPILVTNQFNTIGAGQITSLTFKKYDASASNYIVVTFASLLSSAQTYADFRKSTVGGGYNTLVVNVQDIYNQFNYGETSPLALRRFFDHMIQGSTENRKKHIFLIGKSLSYPSGYEKLVKDTDPNDLPTLGYPGSDFLLVEGLGGDAQDVQSISIGRLPVTTANQVSDYLDKVKEYELASKNGDTWLKEVLHLSGGKTDNEITDFQGYLSTIAGKATSAGKTVTPSAKPSITDTPIVNSVITKINNGVGMMTYFGHGSPSATDYNMGFATTAGGVVVNGGYSNAGKYPFMYFNGCGTGDIFAVSYNSLTQDWVTAKNRGAIAILANSYIAYVSSSNTYVKALYNALFTTARLPIGEVQKTTSKAVRANFPSNLDIQNLHQSVLQGDPALYILQTDNPLPVDLISFKPVLVNNQVNVTWKTASETNNKNFVVERSENAKVFTEVGYVEGKGNSSAENTYLWIDNTPLTGVNYYRLKQIDFDGKVSYSRIESVNLKNGSLLKVYPNPTDDFIEIELANSKELYSWHLINSQGQVMKSAVNGSKRISLKSVPTGTYVLEIITKDGNVLNKQIFKK